jgi:DNA repair protein REV1
VGCAQELKHLMALHGGYFENYYSRDRVTHIICSNLPDAKVKHFQRERWDMVSSL